MTRTEFGIVVGPLALVGLLVWGGHSVPAPAPPAVVKVVPYPVPAPANTTVREVLA